MKPHRDKLILGIVILTLFAAQVFVTYRYLTSIVPGANDFYSRWAGARALLQEGRDPYGLDVTYEIQEVIAVSHSQVGRGGFAYPLHIIFLFWPLIYLSYPWAQAVWWVMLQWMAVGTAVALLRLHQQTVRPGLLVSIILFVVAFYPITRSIFLGQFTIPVLLAVALCLLALQHNQDILAGGMLAVASIKPQMVIFLAPWILLWIISQKRWHFLTGFLGTGAALFVAALALFPRWPLSFLEDVQRYRVVAGGRNPLAFTLETIWPTVPDAVFSIIATILFLAMLFIWWRSWGKDQAHFERALYWAIAVELLITFQTGTTNQVLLLIPIFAALVWGVNRWGWGVSLGTAVILSMLLWTLFIKTISGNAEARILFLPLPWLSLIILISIELARARQPQLV